MMMGVDFSFSYEATSRFGEAPGFGSVQDKVHDAVEQALHDLGLRVDNFSIMLRVGS